MSESDQTLLPVASSTEVDVDGITSTTASEGMFPPASSESPSCKARHKVKRKQNHRGQKSVSTHVTSVPDTPPLDNMAPSTSAVATIFPSRVLRPRRTAQAEPRKPTSPVPSTSSDSENYTPRRRRRRRLQRVVADSSDSEVSAPITRSRIRLEETRKDREAARRLKSFVQAEQHPSITDANTHGTKPRSVTAKGFRLTIEKASCIKSVEESSSSASSDEESQPVSMRLRLRRHTQTGKNSSRSEDNVNGVVSNKQSQSSDSKEESQPVSMRLRLRHHTQVGKTAEDDVNGVVSNKQSQSSDSEEESQPVSMRLRLRHHTQVGKTGSYPEDDVNGVVSNKQSQSSDSEEESQPVSMRLRLRDHTQTGKTGSYPEDDVNGVVSNKQSQSSDSEEESQPVSMHLRLRHHTQMGKNSSRSEDDVNGAVSNKQSQSSDSEFSEQTQSHMQEESSSESSEDGKEWTPSLSEVQSKNSNLKDETRRIAALKQKGRKGVGISGEEDESISSECSSSKVQSNQKVKTALMMKTSSPGKEVKCSRCGTSLKRPLTKHCRECASSTTPIPGQEKDLPSAGERPMRRQRIQFNHRLASNVTVTRSPGQREDLPSTRRSPRKRKRALSDNEVASNVTVTQSPGQKEDLPSTRRSPRKRKIVLSDNEVASNVTVTYSPGQKEDMPSPTRMQAKKQRIEQMEDLASTTRMQTKKLRVQSGVELTSSPTVAQYQRQMEDLPSRKDKPKRRRGVKSDDEVASNVTVTQNSTRKDVPSAEGSPKKGQADILASVTATQSPKQKDVRSTKERAAKKTNIRLDDVLPPNIIFTRSARQNNGAQSTRGRQNKRQRVESDNDSTSNIIVTPSTMQKEGAQSTRRSPRKSQSDDDLASNVAVTRSTRQKEGTPPTSGRPRKRQRVHFDDDTTVIQSTRQEGDVQSARERPKKRQRVRFHNASDSGNSKQMKRQRNAPDCKLDRSRVPQDMLNSSCFLSPQPTQSEIRLSEPAENELESEVDGIETVNLENDCIISVQPECLVEEPTGVAVKSRKQTCPATPELFSAPGAPGERNDFIKEGTQASEHETREYPEPVAVRLSPFDEQLLSTASPQCSAGEDLQATHLASPGKVPSPESHQLPWKDYDKEVLKGTGNGLRSVEAPRGNSDEYSGYADSAGEGCLSEHTTASVWVRSIRHSGTSTQSKARTKTGQYHQAVTRTKNIKLPGHTKLFNVRKAPQKSAMSHSPTTSNKAHEVSSERIIKEKNVSARKSAKVSQTVDCRKKCKLENTESSSGNETDSLAPIQVGAILYSPNVDTKQLMSKPATEAEERQASRHERLTTREKITEKGQHTTASPRKGGVYNSNEKTALVKENCEPLRLNVTFKDEDNECQKSQSFFHDATDSGSEDSTVHPLTSEHSQPETVNLIDEEVENTQAYTQYDYAPLEKVAYASESETVVSDSTASYSPVYPKKPSLPKIYAFRRR